MATKTTYSGVQVHQPKKKTDHKRYANEMENELINVIDAQRMFDSEFRALQEIDKGVDLSDPLSIDRANEHEDKIYARMLRRWQRKSLREAVEIQDHAGTVSILSEAKSLEDEKSLRRAAKTVVELTGKDGGPIETMRRIGPAEFEKYGALLELIRNEQKTRLIPIGLTEP